MALDVVHLRYLHYYLPKRTRGFPKMEFDPVHQSVLELWGTRAGFFFCCNSKFDSKKKRNGFKNSDKAKNIGRKLGKNQAVSPCERSPNDLGYNHSAPANK